MRQAVILFLVVLICFHSTAFGQGPAKRSNPARSKVAKVLEAASVPGASVAVFRDGKLVWNESFGFADLEQRVPASGSTLFGIGSISKSLTTVLAFRLAEKGMIDLDAPIERYLSDFPFAGRGITVRSIATHLSGYEDAFDDRNFYSTRRYGSTSEVLKEFYREEPKFAVGERSVYGTTTFTLIAAVIEKVTGRSFEQAMNEFLLVPAQLRSIVLNDRRRLITHRTEFYELDANRVTVNGEFFDPSFKYAGAGFLATASDLARFGQVLVRGELLGDRSVRALFTPAKTNGGEQTVFAPGFRVVFEGEREYIFQPGGGIGISGVLFIDRKRRVSVAVLTNLTGAPVGGIGFLRSIAEEF